MSIATFRCNNAGESIKFKEKFIQIRKKINVEFLALNTSQQNRIIEKAFAT